MADILDLQAEIISRALSALQEQISEVTYLEIASLAESGDFLTEGKLQALLVKAAAAQATNAQIESVTAQGIRGIRGPITFALHGKSLLLHGDNGTGKSSLDRALRWALLDEDVPSTDAAYSTEESYRRHIAVPPDYPKVAVTFVGGSSIAVEIGKVTTEKDGAQLRAAFKAASPFLRRSELLEVLSSRPTERFQYFESFLGLSKVDHLIEGLASKKAASEGRRTQIGAKRDLAIGTSSALIPPGYGKPETAAELEQLALTWIGDLKIETASQTTADLAKTLREQAAAAAKGDNDRKRARLEQLLPTT